MGVIPSLREVHPVHPASPSCNPVSLFNIRDSEREILRLEQEEPTQKIFEIAEDESLRSLPLRDLRGFA